MGVFANLKPRGDAESAFEMTVEENGATRVDLSKCWIKDFFFTAPFVLSFKDGFSN